MKHRSKNYQPSKPTPIKTTFMELLDELSSITKDDDQVLAAVKNIFNSYEIRFTHTLAPVRLVGDGESTRELRRANLGRRSSAWA
jgi:hypothetical protein